MIFLFLDIIMFLVFVILGLVYLFFKNLFIKEKKEKYFMFLNYLLLLLRIILF